MRIAVASGKGGTGKTTLATNLAVAAARDGRRVLLMDCDVEAPNCHLFLKPRHLDRQPATTPVPRIEAERCTLCGECAAVCEFNALACLPEQVMVFPELCHGCGGCRLFCPEKCISEVPRVIGEVISAQAYGLDLTWGELKIGEAMAPPLIRQVLAGADDSDLAIVDAPPGTSCPVVAAVGGCDFVVLVTEPTPFGLHDLKLAVEMTRCLDLPCGVVINRANARDQTAMDCCNSLGVPVLAAIPNNRQVAELYATGHLCLDYLSDFARLMPRILHSVYMAIVEVGA